MIEKTLHNDHLADPPAVARSKGSFFRPELDLLRFAAFSLVFIHHGFALTQQIPMRGLASEIVEVIRYASGYGLCLFFLLSSYLITEIVLRERESTGTIHIKAFYVRRILRIWPLYSVFLLIGFVVGQIFMSLHISPGFVLQYVFLMGNYAFYHESTGNPIGPLWSISVEEQFYLCWPFLAMRFGRRGLLILSAVLIPVAIVWSGWLTAYAVHPGFAIWTNSITEFECFAVGALLAIAMHGRTWRIHPGYRIGLMVAGLSCWVVSDGVFHFKRGELLADRQMVPHVLGFQLIIGGCALLFLSILGQPLRSWCKPLTYLGRISYGLYVFHILAFYVALRVVQAKAFEHLSHGAWENVLVAVIAFAITVVLANCSYQFYEKRFLRLKDRFTFVQTNKPPPIQGTST